MRETLRRGTDRDRHGGDQTCEGAGRSGSDMSGTDGRGRDSRRTDRRETHMRGTGNIHKIQPEHRHD